MTRWAGQVSPDAAWPGYPRPQMVRSRWLNLNGLWQYAITAHSDESPRFEGEILVPFPLESALSGVKRPLLPDQRLWYRRTVAVPGGWRGERILLHFGAVDWETVVWINGRRAGAHTGKFSPFSFDITDALRAGLNEILVAVRDPTDSHWQSRGKQVLRPRNIWYTAVSGIWQTVWLEPVGPTHVQRLRLTPDIHAQTLTAEVVVHGGEGGEEIRVTAWAADTQVSQATGRPGSPLCLHLPQPRLWSPADPHLYGLRVGLYRHGRRIDEVSSHFGMRSFHVGPDPQGRVRLHLNDRPLFHYGPLDQGYWPDGLYTPPSTTAMQADVDFVKSAGCNMLRKHVKVEPAQFYAYCDRKGIIVWQDMPNGARAVGPVISVVAAALGGWPRRDTRNYAKAGRQDPRSRADFRRELRELVDHLYNFASIGMWVPFNEGWGQFDARAIAEWLRSYDPTRPVDHASGWFDQGGGDFRSIHSYVKPLRAQAPEGGRGIVLAEFGGYGLRVPGHLWGRGGHLGYGRSRSPAALAARYRRLLERELRPWVQAGLSGAVYTQLTDVEGELNGWLTYDRGVAKIEARQLREAHRAVLPMASPRRR